MSAPNEREVANRGWLWVNAATTLRDWEPQFPTTAGIIVEQRARVIEYRTAFIRALVAREADAAAKAQATMRDAFNAAVEDTVPEITDEAFEDGLTEGARRVAADVVTIMQDAVDALARYQLTGEARRLVESHKTMRAYIDTVRTVELAERQAREKNDV